MCRRADLVVGPPQGPSRIFLARKEFRHRKLVNHGEIEALAEAHGFAIVYPEDFDFAGQARLLRNARFVAGPEGSAFFLCLFLDQGAKICILNHENTAGLVAYNGGNEAGADDVTIITGPQATPLHGSPQDVGYVIDANVFRGFLEGWLSAPASKGEG